MELYPVRNVSGFPEITWSIRQWFRRRRSADWIRTTATVEGYELLIGKDDGWLVVFYSYAFGREQYSGEFRKWLLFTFSSKEARAAKVIERFPRGAILSVRVNAHSPEESILD